MKNRISPWNSLNSYTHCDCELIHLVYNWFLPCTERRRDPAIFRAAQENSPETASARRVEFELFNDFVRTSFQLLRRPSVRHPSHPDSQSQLWTHVHLPDTKTGKCRRRDVLTRSGLVGAQQNGPSRDVPMPVLMIIVILFRFPIIVFVFQIPRLSVWRLAGTVRHRRRYVGRLRMFI